MLKLGLHYIIKKGNCNILMSVKELDMSAVGANNKKGSVVPV